MGGFLFWKDRPMPIKILISLFLTFLVIAGGFMIYQISIDGSAITWDTDPELRPIKTTFETFNNNGFDLDVKQYSFLINDYYLPGNPEISPILSYTFFGIVSLALILFFTFMTNLETFWYYVFAGIGIFIIAGLRPESTGALGRVDKVFMLIIIIAFTGTSFLFQTYQHKIAFVYRFCGFLLLAFGVYIIVQFTSTEPMPFVLFSSYALIPFIFITLLFFLLIGDVLIYAFLFLTTSYSNTKKPFQNFYYFMAISLLYLGSLLIHFLKNHNYLDWDVVINPLIIFIASTLVGFWVFKRKSDLFPTALAYQPNGILLYLAMAVISFATIGYFLAAENKVMIAVLEEGLVITHLALGFVFFLYCVYNFYHLFKVGKKIYQFAFKPQRLPYFSLYLFGLVCVGALILRGGTLHKDGIISGYYTAIGDGYRLSENKTDAKEFYKQAKYYKFSDFRSTLSLVDMAEEEMNYAASLTLLEEALESKKYPEFYAKLGKNYLEQAQYFKALFNIKEGVQAFPDNGYLNNNLGLLYGKANLLDSTYLYLKRAEQQLPRDEVAISNLLSIFVEKERPDYADSLIAQYDFNHLQWETNKFAHLAKIQQKTLPEFDQTVIEDTILTQYEFMYINNYMLSGIKQVDDALVKKIEKLTTYQINKPFKEDLDWLISLVGYYNGNTMPSLERMMEIQLSAASLGTEYANIIGLYMHKHGVPSQALEHLQYAYEKGYLDALFQYPLVQSAIGDRNQAIKHWTFNTKVSKNDSLRALSNYMLKLIKTPFSDTVFNWSDLDQFRYMAFNTDRLTKAELLQIQQGIKDKAIRNKAILLLIELSIKNKEYENAAEIIKHLNKNNFDTDQRIQLNIAKLKIFIGSRYITLNPSAIDGLDIPREFTYLKNYALAKAHKGTDKAMAYYKKALQQFILFEPGLFNAVEVFNKSNKQQEAYDLLIKALNWTPNSIELNKVFALQCLEIGYEYEAENILEDLKGLMEPEAFNAFLVIFNQKQSALQSDWESPDF